MDDHTAASSRLAKDKGALYSDIPVAETLLDGFGWISIADHFIKTGEKPQDPYDQISRSYEYSQSGGDDMVAQQGGASFDGDQSIEASKARAGKGNVVNPLELSPATGELSKIMSEEFTSKSEDRKPGDVSGHHSGRKTQTVRKTEIDFK